MSRFVRALARSELLYVEHASHSERVEWLKSEFVVGRSAKSNVRPCCYKHDHGGSERRKRHVQLELLNATGTAVKSKRGGKRRGAGRRARGPRPSERHKKRASFRRDQPLLVTLRLVADVQPLRRKDIYAALRAATRAVAGNQTMRIIEVSLQSSHVHLLVEADGRRELASGIQGFAISAAKHINRAISIRRGIRRRGKVFADRYHLRVITTPRQMRSTLAYVFNNWRKHREENASPGWRVDPFSTAALFDGWRDGAYLDRDRYPAEFEHFAVKPAQTWLLRIGWRKHGLLDWREVPGRPDVRAASSVR